MKHFLLLLAFTLVATDLSANTGTCWLKESGCRAYIGKRLWVAIPAGNPNTVELTFKQHDWTTSQTLKLRNGISFVVIGLSKANVGSDEYKVRLDDGRVGWVGTSSPFLIDFDPIARARAVQEECARRGQPKLGMSQQELLETCWRKPNRTSKKTTSSGIEETFLYGSGRAVKLMDGKVVEIIETQ